MGFCFEAKKTVFLSPFSSKWSPGISSSVQISFDKYHSFISVRQHAAAASRTDGQSRGQAATYRQGNFSALFLNIYSVQFRNCPLSRSWLQYFIHFVPTDSGRPSLFELHVVAGRQPLLAPMSVTCNSNWSTRINFNLVLGFLVAFFIGGLLL